RGSWRYQRKERHEAALRARLRELAGERPRFGYRRLHRLLRREKKHGGVKWMVNHKRGYWPVSGEGIGVKPPERQAISCQNADAVGTANASEPNVDHGFHS